MLAITEPYVHTRVGYQGREISFDMLCSEDHLLQFQNVNYIYEPEVIAAFLHFVRPGDICIDAGANLGYHSLLLSRLVGPAGEILAFDPDPNCIAAIKANAKLNGIENICPLRMALWSDATEKPFNIASVSGYSSFLEYIDIQKEKISLLTARLDDIINLDAHIRLLKIDCEGSEERILHGAIELLRRGVDCVIVEFNFKIMPQFGSTDIAIRQLMDGLGYDFFVLNLDSSPPLHVPVDIKITLAGDKWHYNWMFCKRGAFDVATWKRWEIL